MLQHEEQRAADDINQDDNTDSASHFAKCHFDIRKSNSLSPQQLNTAVKFHCTKCTCVYTHLHVPPSSQVTQHINTDNMIDKMNSHKGSIHIKRSHRHTQMCIQQTHTQRHTNAHRCIFTNTNTSQYMHTDSGTHTQETWLHVQTHIPRHTLRLIHKDPYPNICTYRNAHTHINTPRSKIPRQRNTQTHTRESKKHSPQP